MRRKRIEGTPSLRTAMEALETRQLLSGVPAAHPHTLAMPAGHGSAADGYTPAQIRQVYGFDQLGGDGAGQTIAIIDAFKHPNIVSDLEIFDAKYGIPAPPSFQIVGQSGGSVNGLRIDTGWASEVSLDVEWAHAIAPGANLLLIEARSDGFSDLMAGVNYARSIPGVSVISMSWGGSEFRGQLKYDASFSTPAGHQGITFVAASGDDGMRYGAEWPATSSSVVGVGGTTLTLGQGAGEIAWDQATGGVSRFETKPWFQVGVQGAGRRATPDVSFAADPNTGFSVYCSVKDQGIVGWQSLGGTSAGTPQWAAQVAVANQLRAAAGLNTLDSVGGTLPALYRSYSAPGTMGYAGYTAAFNDIVDGHSGRVAAVAGYDDVTGLGSPHGGVVVANLLHASSPNVTAAKPNAAPKTKKGSAHPSVDRAKPADRVPDATPAAVEAYVRPAARGAGLTAARGATAQDLAEPVKTSLSDHSTFAASGEHSRMPQGAVKFTAVSYLPQLAVKTALASLNLPPPAVSGVAMAAGDAVEATVQSIDTAIPLALELGRQEALASFADALASFAHESTAMEAVAIPSHFRAWAITCAVLGVDAVLIGYWRMTRKPAGRSRVRESSPFSRCRI